MQLKRNESIHPLRQLQSWSRLNSGTKSSYPAAEVFSSSPPQNEVEPTRIHHAVTELITGSPPLSVNAQSHHFSWLVAACSIWEASIHISTPPTHTTSLTLSLGYSILVMDSCLTVSIRVCVCVCVCVCSIKQSVPKMSCLISWMFGWQCQVFWFQYLDVTVTPPAVIHCWITWSHTQTHTDANRNIK